MKSFFPSQLFGKLKSAYHCVSRFCALSCLLSSYSCLKFFYLSLSSSLMHILYERKCFTHFFYLIVSPPTRILLHSHRQWETIPFLIFNPLSRSLSKSWNTNSTTICTAVTVTTCHVLPCIFLSYQQFPCLSLLFISKSDRRLSADPYKSLWGLLLIIMLLYFLKPLMR